MRRKVSDLTEKETFLARAAQAKAEADMATLDNVRERCLRAASAWDQMASRAERAEKMRADLIREKAEAQAAAAVQ